MTTLLERIRAARDFESGRFVRLEADGPIGWIRRDFVARLTRWPECFAIDEGSVRLRPQGEADRTAALAQVTRALAEDGTIPGWRDETYAIPHDAPLFHIERAAVDFFGLTSAASHLNGWVRSAGGLRIWIARRSATKSIDPGFLDTLVGGGIPSGQDASQTLLRECHEEAGIERELAMRSSATATLEVRHEVPRGLHSEILYAHDLELPADFRPRNVDGEVAEFMLLSAAETADRVASGEFTVEAGLVTLDFLLRTAAIAPDPALIAALDRCRLRPVVSSR
jgi:8-oxo-dGTP pyrophosphatase MutT (NUDIX family)